MIEDFVEKFESYNDAIFMDIARILSVLLERIILLEREVEELRCKK